MCGGCYCGVCNVYVSLFLVYGLAVVQFWNLDSISLSLYYNEVWITSAGLKTWQLDLLKITAHQQVW